MERLARHIGKNKHFREIAIPGGFDLFHQNHKDFITRCIGHAEGEIRFDRVVIWLASDKDLAKKGSNRPFFTYEWRKEDVKKWIQIQPSKYEYSFEELNICELISQSTAPDPQRMVVGSAEYENKWQSALWKSKNAGMIYVPPIGVFHTSDIENALLQKKDESKCRVNKVAAMLIQDGIVQAAHCNGGENICNDCGKYESILEHFNETEQIVPSNIPCNHPHAEIKCMENSKPKSSLIATTSPCLDCSHEIVKYGIERVVYLSPYHDQKASDFLTQNGVKVRKAGI